MRQEIIFGSVKIWLQGYEYKKVCSDIDSREISEHFGNILQPLCRQIRKETGHVIAKRTEIYLGRWVCHEFDFDKAPVVTAFRRFSNFACRFV
jgi:hypothetical protein